MIAAQVARDLTHPDSLTAVNVPALRAGTASPVWPLIRRSVGGGSHNYQRLADAAMTGRRTRRARREAA